MNFYSIGKNFGWSLLARIGTFALKFATVPILARMLKPEEFGAMAVALIVIGFLIMIGNGGLGSSLVIRRTQDEQAYHTVFWANLIVAVGLTLGLYVFAEEIAGFLGATEAAPIIRAMSFMVPLQLAASVVYAILNQRMAFRQDAQWSLVSETIGAVSAIILALQGFGVWALVFQQFIAAIIRITGIAWAMRYRPKWQFSWQRLKELWSHGIKLLGADMTLFFVFESPTVIISRNLGLSATGTYSVVKNFSEIPNQIILTSLMGVLFPAFSAMQDDKERRVRAITLSARMTSLILTPILFGIWALAEPLTRIVLGEKWMHAAPILGVLCIAKLLMSPCGSYIPYLRGLGFTRELLHIAIGRLILTVGILYAVTLHGTLMDAMVAFCVINFITVIGYSAYVFKVNGQNQMDSFVQVMQPLILAGVMAIIVRALYLTFGTELHVVLQLALFVPMGGAIYGALLWIFERELVMDLWMRLRQREKWRAQ